MHGGGVDAPVYRRFAERLSTDFRTHIYNRRGRGASAPRPTPYTTETEVADLDSVVVATGSARVVAHSAGGFFALEAARTIPLQRLALFDPVVSVDGSFPVDFMPEFERAISEGRRMDAVLIMGKGLRNPGYKLPTAVQRPLVRAVMATPAGRSMVELLPTVPAEAKLASAADGPAEQWSDITVPTRFFIGARSPDYYLPTAERLAVAMPDATVEVIPKLGHDAIARAPRGLIAALAGFLR